jgi:O-antigen/teichoic acid export membrane protein
MGIVKKDALKTTLISYAGLVLGYLNKAFLFILFLTTIEIGLVNLLSTTGLLFAQLCNLGSIYVTWRFFPFFRNKEKRNYGFLMLNVLIVLIGISLFSTLFFVFKAQIVAYFTEKSPLFVAYAWWVIPVGIGNVFFMLFENYMRGLYKNVLPVFLQDIVLRLITTVCLLLFAAQWISFEHCMIAMMVSNLFPASVLFFYLLAKGEIHLSLRHITVPKRFRKLILTFSLFSYINTLATILVVSMDALMIGSMIGLAATGIYTTMMQVTSAVQIPFRAMTRVSSPIVAKLWKEKDLVGLQAIYKKSSGAGLFIGLFSFLALWLPREELFSFLNPDFKAGLPVLCFLLIGKVVDMYCGLNGIIFATSRKYKFDLLFTLFLCVGIYFMNRWLIPIYGISGVGFSTGFIYVFYNLARSYYIYRSYRLNPFDWGQLRPIVWFGLVLLLYFLVIPMLPFEMDSSKWERIIRLLTIELYVVVVFVVPVLYFKWEPETAGFVRSFFERIFAKRLNRKFRP